MGRPLPDEASDEIERISNILAAMTETGTEGLDWLNTPRDAFDGLTPLEYISEYPERASFVRQYLEQTFYSIRKVS